MPGMEVRSLYVLSGSDDRGPGKCNNYSKLEQQKRRCCCSVVVFLGVFFFKLGKGKMRSLLASPYAIESVT